MQLCHLSWLSGLPLASMASTQEDTALLSCPFPGTSASLRLLEVDDYPEW